MEELDLDRPPTPPHQPTAGVRILRQEILSILQHGFPDYEIVSVVQSAPGKSYNNRIYFLKLRRPGAVQSELGLVLKVNGRFFGPNKVQNEVSCLRLLEKHSPSVPAPRALAWSEDGHLATFQTPFARRSCLLDMPTGCNKLDHGGWILMTKLPGTPLADTDFNETGATNLAHQLGDIVTSWRTEIPAQSCCGNIRLWEHGNGQNEAEEPLIIEGALHMGIDTSHPITDINEYYQIKLESSLSKLETSDTFGRSRYLATPIRKFIHDVLPKLDLCPYERPQPKKYVFTHYDLSPRNILIAGEPPRIVGIVDFEFGGFFPAVEEFLNDFISNKGNFTNEFYNSYLRRLEENGIATPDATFDPIIWNRSYWLETLVLRTAPWDLPGAYQGDELEKQLRDAESDVALMLEKLNVSHSTPRGTQAARESYLG
ncbi:hypothetical protein TWF718_010029 [Orbilia javanica]|uniref:Aminoglycoside phosphotransferase domain-containing protein n=1 Tax=Orbilia javanica TaxID=47235 RepID=A0AAN8MQL8_9PEZI